MNQRILVILVIDLLWTAVQEEQTYYLTDLVFSEKKTDFYYSVPTLGNPWTYDKQG